MKQDLQFIVVLVGEREKVAGTVLVVRPAQSEPRLGERLVERGEVQVALGVCDHAVAVEDQRSQTWPIVGSIGGSLWVQGHPSGRRPAVHAPRKMRQSPHAASPWPP